MEHFAYSGAARQDKAECQCEGFVHGDSLRGSVEIGCLPAAQVLQSAALHITLPLRGGGQLLD